MSKEVFSIIATFTDIHAEESPHENKVPYYHLVRMDPEDELNYEVIETFDTFEEAKKKLDEFESGTTPCGEEQP